MMPLPYKLLVLALAFVAPVAAVLGYGHRQYTQGVTTTTARYEAALAQQKAQAATLLATEIAKTRATEQALQTLKNQQELSDAKNQKIVAGLFDRLRGIAGPAWRLRDPNAPRCWPGSGSTPGAAASAPRDRAADPAEAGGLLSVQLSELLGRVLREADDINVAYSSCRADVYTVREAQPKP